MDARKWLLLEERPSPNALRDLVGDCPDGKWRCPSVLRLYLAARRHGFHLTTPWGQPTETLHVMVRELGGRLSQADDLPKEERRNFTHRKGSVIPEYQDRWFITDISQRLRCEPSSAVWGNYSWLRRMFPDLSRGHVLWKERVVDYVDGEKVRRQRYLICCPKDWRITQDVYQGVYWWTHGSRSDYLYTYDLIAGEVGVGGHPQVAVSQ